MDHLYHVHDILHYLQHNKNNTLNDLAEYLKEMYGSDCRFTTCGNHVLSINEAIEFIIERKKAYVKGDKIFLFSDAHMCD